MLINKIRFRDGKIVRKLSESSKKARNILVSFVIIVVCTDGVQADETRGQLDLAYKIIQEQSSTIWPEIKDIAKAPFDNPKESVKWGLLIAGLVAVDKPITQYYQQHVEPSLGWKLDSINPTFPGADGYIVYGLGVHYFGSVMVGDEKGQQVSLMAGKAMAYSAVFTHLILKPLFGRNRPSSDLASCPAVTAPYTCDPSDFGHHYAPSLGPVQYGSAMPSFHFTMYFSVARVYQLAYDNYWLPYGLAALAATSNIEGHKHWVSDMVAGSALGILIGTQVYKHSYHGPYGERRRLTKMVLPILDANRVGIDVIYRF